jgi:O-antigen/teichoic acid export membrane protein
MGGALLAFACNICLCFLLIPPLGFKGAAIATSISCGIGLGICVCILKVFVVPRIHYSVVLLPLFFFEHITGIFQSRITTMIIYAAFGLPFIGIYLYLSRKYLYR